MIVETTRTPAPRSPSRRLRRTGLFLLTWGTPAAIGFLLGAAANRPALARTDTTVERASPLPAQR